MKKKVQATMFPRTMALIDHLKRGIETGDTKVTPKEFSEMLEMNEDSMGEGAAMMATCQMFGLSWEEGHDLLIQASEEEE